MIRSMTGFGRASAKIGTWDVAIEIRSVNSRFLELSVRGPRGMERLEDMGRQAIQERIPRGRLTLTISLGNGTTQTSQPRLNASALDAYREIIREAGDRLDIQEDLGLPQILALPEVIHYEPDPDDVATLEKGFGKLLDQALDQLDTMREREGELLKTALSEHLEALAGYLGQIEVVDEERLPELARRLRRKVQDLETESELSVDEQRLEQEIVFWSDRLDIREELVRLDAHIAHFRGLMDQPEDAGKRLNFLLQEMNREANTIGSKAYSTAISHAIVDVKNEIERLREQVQNIQ